MVTLSDTFVDNPVLNSAFLEIRDIYDAEKAMRAFLAETRSRRVA